MTHKLLKVLLSLLPQALAYYRSATSVTGDVVAGAGDLTAGGKVGTYTVLLQVLNPGLGDLKMLLECCGGARHYAAEIANKINTNFFAGDEEDDIKAQFVGEGKCSAPGVVASLKHKGKSQCDYVYSFENKDWRMYEYTAQCVPSDVCSVDVAGATKGLKATYPVVIQILNRNAGDMLYAGSGPIANCLQGMNTVNQAQSDNFKKTEQTFVNVFGHQIPTGSKEVMDIKGMKQLNIMEMFTPCSGTSEEGMLYVFKNKFWINHQHAMNVTDFDLALQKAQRQKDLEDLLNYPMPKEGSEEPEPAAAPAPPPSGFDLAEAIGELGAVLSHDLGKKDVGAEAVQDKVNEAEDKIQEQQEEKQAKMAKAQKELQDYEDELAEKAKAAAAAAAPPAPEAPAAPEAPEATAAGYGGDVGDTGKGGDDIYGGKAPEVPEAPELPKVKVPEVPKAPTPPKIEVPEAPELPKVKVPEVPKAPTPPKIEVPEVPAKPAAPAVPEVPKAPSVTAAPKAHAHASHQAHHARASHQAHNAHGTHQVHTSHGTHQAHKSHKPAAPEAPTEVSSRRLEEHIMV